MPVKTLKSVSAGRSVLRKTPRCNRSRQRIKAPYRLTTKEMRIPSRLAEELQLQALARPAKERHRRFQTVKTKRKPGGIAGASIEHRPGSRLVPIPRLSWADHRLFRSEIAAAAK